MHNSRTRLVFVNGYLGAGKTTTIAALASRLVSRGLSAAVITNDQAAQLVDTERIRILGVPVAEVAAGCFCCRFSDLVVVLDQLMAHDVILCEAVGSCTDVVATVIRPLRRFYGDAISIAPFFVVVDARAQDEMLEELRYLREKQIAEADVVLVNKIDLECGGLPPLFESGGKPPHSKAISALRGDGLDTVLALILGDAEGGAHPLQELDYDTYARAEAMLAWMNATVRGAIDPRELVADLTSVTTAVHVKAIECDGGVNVNARVLGDAAELRSTFERIARDRNLEILTLDAFHPAYPRPEHRL